MTPGDLVRAWVDAFNRADPDALAGFYAEDAINHQVAETPVHGRAAIKEMFAAGFASAAMVSSSRISLRMASGRSSSGAIRVVCADAASFT